jgi:pantothenate kinase
MLLLTKQNCQYLQTYLNEQMYMSELRNIYLTIVAENQKHKIKAERLSELIKSELGDDWTILIIDK